jgi:peptidyl-prolyl cis-trans isomerase A (cyclophilin A)
LVLVALCLLSTARSSSEVSVAEGAESATAALPAGWYARIETRLGTILVRLLPEQAPQTVAHFRALAEGELAWTTQAGEEPRKARYFDGIPVTFTEAGRQFRVGQSRKEGELVRLSTPPEGLSGPVGFNAPGRLGIPLLGANYNPAQFFVTTAGLSWLQGTMPCIGEVVSGLDVAIRIADSKTEGHGTPIEPVVIERLSVFPSGEPEPLPALQPYEGQKPKQLELRRRSG